MSIKNLLIIGVASLIISCGPSKEEIAKREKFVADSLNVVREDSIARVEERIEMERIHKERIEVGKSINKTNLTKILDQLNLELKQERQNLSQINVFQIGRSTTTKQEQLDAQNDLILQLENSITKVEKEISNTNLFNSFDFQLTPEGVVEHIFTSAVNSDFSKMRHLLDPYGEYEVDAQQICLVEMFPNEGQKEWKNIFANGRVMSEPIINEDMAEIEIAIGSSSDRLEKIKLVRRMDKWYVIGM